MWNQWIENDLLKTVRLRGVKQNFLREAKKR